MKMKKEKSIRVRKDGRVNLPKSLVEGCGLSPGDVVDLKDWELRGKGYGRRTFMRIVWGVGTLVSSLGAMEGILSGLQRLGLYEPDADDKMLRRLFGLTGAQSGSLMPAANHPFKPPPSDMLGYPTEEACCEAYRQRFHADLTLREVRGCPELREDDAIVLFGSQVSNLNTRTLLGNPWRESPVLQIVQRGWRTSLHWNLITPADAPVVERKQFGGRWLTWSHRIVGDDGSRFESVYQQGLQIDDYLLVTSLPRYGSGPQRIVAMGGLHGAGQKASTVILRRPPMRELEKLDHKIGQEPYCQALFHVSVKQDQTGELVPGDISLVDAKVLHVHRT
jgi:hypothetical protein